MKRNNFPVFVACIVITFGFTNNFMMNCNAKAKKQSITVTSSAFEESGMIPAKYTCDGINVSPPLSWAKGPDNTKTFALICDDPDAPSKTWVHWVLYNIPSTVIALPENVPTTDMVLSSALNGINDFPTSGYSGPCPPSGVHRYNFKVYALDCELPLKSGETANAVETAMKDHVLASGMLMGKYQRK